MSDSTLRLLMPQWQGGNNAVYHFGAQLLAWLAPEHHGITENVPIPPPENILHDDTLVVESGLVARNALLEQINSAKHIIQRHQPKRIVTLGGDCLVSLAPFSYLNQRYDGDVAVLWIDAHPDLNIPQHFSHGHAMVLGNLLGEGDPDFVKQVVLPFQADRLLYAGFSGGEPYEIEVMKRLHLPSISAEELAHSTDGLLNWFKNTGAKHLVVHLDLDALDPHWFRSLLFARPVAEGETALPGIPHGKLRIETLVSMLEDIANISDVVGITIAEHTPWDAIALKQMLARLPLMQ
ncbi:arginase family protein [Budviciaceae bacterium CWB-B4]|uniref:Arginase family protein n=1 Tax=Limnobaculum xujianqingii TaxID=2738837 RepID=A0A9D7FXG9_9GAMM|nr:arginase family protein [Limnobaculum xujianqingii]MBK5073006.1 arginase family protein [Limnobaculum xujianqingii]MBK5176315.1 arginase family protein [Limnobaculum xujianqingii]